MKMQTGEILPSFCELDVGWVYMRARTFAIIMHDMFSAYVFLFSQVQTSYVNLSCRY